MLDQTQIVVAVIGGSGIIGAAYVANRNASKALAQSKEAKDVSYPLTVLKETIAELRTENERLTGVIKDLNSTIEYVKEKEKNKVEALELNRDALIIKCRGLERKIEALEAEKKIMENK